MYRLRVLNQLKGRLTDLPLYAHLFKNTSSLTIRRDPTFTYIQDLLVAMGAMGLSLNAHSTVFILSGAGLYGIQHHSRYALSKILFKNM